ncbi:hypothetical protein MQE22_08755 [Acidithiobacillus sp. YTS05]|nr:hypothetical protein MQE22_08755 [Acidithiobacillus sp. YTS05]
MTVRFVDLGERDPQALKKLLDQFCGGENCGFAWARRLLRGDGYLYASNGHIVVRVPDHPAILAEELTEIPPNIHANLKRYFSIPYDPSCPFPFPKLPKIQPCPVCKGMKRLQYEVCPDCDGEGECGDEECTRCKGWGRINQRPAKVGDHLCDYCDGYGEDPACKTAIGGITYANRYLRLIKKSPGVKLFPTGPETPMVCLFEGGELLLMPMR